MDLNRLLPATYAPDDVARQRLMGLMRLLEVTRTVAEEVDLDTVLATLAREACHAVFCERATVWQYDAKRGELFARAASELEVDELRIHVEEGLTGLVARTRQMINVPDPAADPRWNSKLDPLTGFETRSILSAPLVSPHDDSLLGVLQLLNNLGGPFDEFDELLLEAFCQHASAALDRARLVDQIRHQQSVAASLDVARGVQRGFMPRQLPAIAQYEIASWWFPNQAVGADYCDCMPLPDGRLGLVVADVSGHGLGPSLMMASCRAALRTLALEHTEPERLLSMLHQALAPDLQDGVFITLVLACLDPQRHLVEFSNAGHAPAEHYCRQTDTFHPLEATGLPMGVLDQPDYPQGPAVPMQPGDLLVLCTDGIVESADANGAPFGSHRLRSLVRQYRDATVEQLVQAIGNAVTAHYEGHYPPDDLTILALKRQSAATIS